MRNVIFDSGKFEHNLRDFLCQATSSVEKSLLWFDVALMEISLVFSCNGTKASLIKLVNLYY